MKLNDVDIQAQLVSGTNIQTINGNNILNSGDLIVGGSGVHALLPLASGEQTASNVLVGGFSGSPMVANRLWTYPFFPANTVVSSNLYICYRSSSGWIILSYFNLFR